MDRRGEVDRSGEVNGRRVVVGRVRWMGGRKGKCLLSFMHS